MLENAQPLLPTHNGRQTLAHLAAAFLIAVLCTLVTTVPAAASSSGKAAIKKSLVKIYSSANPANLRSPWQTLKTESYVGSGVIISGNRILTNAHLVADEVSIEVKRQGMTRRYEAHVEHVGHACDLALLKVSDPVFFDGAPPLPFGSLAEIQDRVSVHGFPLGGESVSVTSGIVSRLEVSEYVHSGRELLLMQIDAAINEGNSGGPVIGDGRILGIAVQNLQDAENVGYAVPVPVVKHFLEDVEDGQFDGFPSLGLGWQTIENPALRKSLNLREEHTGALIRRVSYDGTVHGVLESGDVLLEIGGSRLAEDLTVELHEDHRVAARYIVQRRQTGDLLELKFLRDGREHTARVTLKESPPLIPGPLYDRKPKYRIFGGVVFQPVTSDYIHALQDWDWWEHLVYYEGWQNIRTATRRELLLISRVLPSRLTRGYHDWENEIIATVNGVRPRDMQHLNDILDELETGLLTIRTEDDHTMVIDVVRARESGGALLERHGIPRDRSGRHPHRTEKNTEE